MLVPALLAVLASWSPAQTGKPVAAVSRQLQPAVVLRQTQTGAKSSALNSVVLADDAPLFAGDVLETREDGRLRVTLKDGSVLNLGSRTRVRLPDNEPRPRLQVIHGVVRFALVARPGSPIEILTQTALCRIVRGELLLDARSAVATFVLNLGQSPIEVEGERGKATLQPGEGIWSDRGFAGRPPADDLKKMLAEAELK